MVNEYLFDEKIEADCSKIEDCCGCVSRADNL